jgi:hypothetical protein
MLDQMFTLNLNSLVCITSLCLQLASLSTPVVLTDIQFSNVSCCYSAYCDDQGSLTATYGEGNGAGKGMALSWKLLSLSSALGLLVLL